MIMWPTVWHELHHDYPAHLPCGTAGMTRKGGIRIGKVGACFLQLSLWEFVCVCVYVERCVNMCVFVVV